MPCAGQKSSFEDHFDVANIPQTKLMFGESFKDQIGELLLYHIILPLIIKKISLNTRKPSFSTMPH